MKIQFKITLFLTIICLVLSSAPLALEAALYSKYDSPAESGSPEAPKPAASSTEKKEQPKQVKKDTSKQQATSPSLQSTSERVTVVSKKNLTAKETELFKKEHETFCKAYMDAEMGLRYYYKTLYDAKHRGEKAPSDEELDAMRFQLKLLMKDLRYSARRYAGNIRMAKIVMRNMNEDERTLFARTLSRILATPAYALDASSLDNIEAGFNNIANATEDVGYSTEEDYARAEMFNADMAKAGEIIAAATSMVTTTILSGAAIVGGAALTMGAVTTGGAVLGGVVMVGSIVGGGLESSISVIGFIDALTEGDTDLKHAKEVAVTINVLNVAANSPSASIEKIKVIVDLADATKDEWIPRILDESEDPDNPGTEGANKVKGARNDASSYGGGGGGSDGGGSGGGCDC